MDLAYAYDNLLFSDLLGSFQDVVKGKMRPNKKMKIFSDKRDCCNSITLFWQVRFRRGLPPGDGVLFYPGQAFEPELAEPIASIRLERLLGGLQVKKNHPFLNERREKVSFHVTGEK